MSDYLGELERKADDLERFAACQRQANDYISSSGSDQLVAELRQAVAKQRTIRMGTINTLILLHHIDRLEDELARYGA